MGTVLRLGDVDVRPEEAIEILVKASKCTALARPKSWKKFGQREKDDDQMQVDGESEEKAVFAQLKMRTEYYIDRSSQEGQEQENMDTGSDAEEEEREKNIEKVEKEQLIRGFKYGSTYAPCPDGQFPRLSTRKGIDICGFFHAKNVGVTSSSLLCTAHTDIVSPGSGNGRGTIYMGRPWFATAAGRALLHRTSHV